VNHRRRHDNLVELAIVAGLVLLPLLFWWRLWAPDPADRRVIPPGDFSSQYYPLQAFSARELAAGRLPGWDPYLNAGQPGLADIQTGFYYPPNLLPNLVLAVLGWPYSLELMSAQVVFHFMLASLFTYLFVRQLALRAGARRPAARFAAAIAALSFTYGGYLTSFPVQQLTILETAVWLPLVLFFLDRAAHANRPWPALLACALALACGLLAGHPQTSLYLVYMTLAYGLFLAAGRRVYVLLPLFLAFALAAIQLWPTLQFIARSTRAGLSYDSVSGGFPLAEMTHLLYPGYFGGSPQYLGILTPILAAAALFLRSAGRQVVFWLVVAAVALLLAFGGNTFVFSVAYLLAPGFAAVRDQERIVYLFSFAASVLAGYGALTLLQPIARPARKAYHRFARGLSWALAIMAVLTALFYAGYLQGAQQQIAINLFEGVLRHHVLLLIVLGGTAVLFVLRHAGRARGWRIGLALGLIWLNLFTVNWRYNQAEPQPGGPFPETGPVAFLRSQPGPFRVSSAGLLPGGASAGAVYEVEDITANTPLRLASFQDLEEGLGDWRLWQLLNVEFVLSQRDLSGPGLEQVYAENGVSVYRVGDPLPRAWVVYRSQAVADDRALAALDAPDFDPRSTAVLPPESGLPLLSGTAGGQTVRVVEDWPGHLALEAAPSADGVLVVSQPFYPGWRATIDGRPVPVERVDYALQGLPIQAGVHRVELSYHLPLLPAAITVVALLGCLAGLVLATRRV
jgi:hypothetical protein